MYYIEDFFENINALGISVIKFGFDESDKIYQSLLKVFFYKQSHCITNHNKDIPLNNFFDESVVGVHLPNISSKRNFFLQKFPIAGKCYFMFEREVNHNIILFENYENLRLVLENSYNFNFYIFSSEYNFILGWDTHEVLYGGGLASKWVSDIKKEWLAKL